MTKMKITLKEFCDTFLDFTSDICELVLCYKDHWQTLNIQGQLSLQYCSSQIEPYNNFIVSKVSSNMAGLILYIDEP